MMALGGANILDFLMAGSKWAQERALQQDAARIQIFGPKVNNNSGIIKDKNEKVSVRIDIT